MTFYYLSCRFDWPTHVELIFYLLFVDQEEEYYLCIYAQRDCDTILFHHEGGVDIGDVDSKVSTFSIVIYQEKKTCLYNEYKDPDCSVCTHVQSQHSEDY